MTSGMNTSAMRATFNFPTLPPPSTSAKLNKLPDVPKNGKIKAKSYYKYVEKKKTIFVIGKK